MLSLGIGVRITNAVALGGGAVVTPALFSFADDFNSGAETKVYRRPGFEYRTDDARPQSLYNVSSSRMVSGEGFGLRPCFGKDLGYLGGYVEARFVGVFFDAFLIVNYVDRSNYNYLTVNAAGRVQVFRKVAGANSTLFDTGGGTGSASGRVIRLTYSWNAALNTMSLSVTEDGVVPAWTGIPGGGILPTTTSAQLRPSTFVGFGATTLDDFACGHVAPAKPRLSMDRISRVWQQHKTTATKAIPLVGDASGVTGIEFRLTKGGTAVTGWDWGQKTLTGVTIAGGRWSGTTPAIPADNGYDIEVRATNDNMAQCRTESFCIGDVYVVWGQSNANPMGGGNFSSSGVANTWAIGGENSSGVLVGPISHDARSRVFSGPVVATDAAGGFLFAMRSACPDSRAFVFAGEGLGSSSLVLFLPSSVDTGGGTITRYNALIAELDAVGGDCAGVVWSQGEEDSGRSLTLNQFGAPEEAAYRTNLNTLSAAVRSYCGRSASEQPWVLMGLGRYVSGTAGTAYALDASRDRFRKMQWDLCDGPGAVAGYWFAGSQIDIAQGDADHYSNYLECSKRAGAAMARAKTWTTKDRRGPIVTGASRSSFDIIVAFDMQLATGLTCSASIAANFIFKNASGITQTPTLMTMGTGQGTFTFGTTPAAGWTVDTTGGANPIIAGVLMGTQPDAVGVMTMPMFSGPITLT